MNVYDYLKLLSSDLNGNNVSKIFSIIPKYAYFKYE